MNWKRSKTAIIISIALLVIAIPLTMYLVGQQQILKSRAASGRVNLVIDPPQGEKVQGQPFTAALVLRNVGTGPLGDPITGVDVELNFNKYVFDVTFSPNLQSFPQAGILLNTNDTREAQRARCPPPEPGSNCTLRFIAVNPTTAAQGNNVTLGTLTFHPKILTTSTNNGDVTVGFTQIVASSRENDPLAGERSGASFSVVVAVTSPTPTGPITPTPTPTIGPTTCTCQTNNTCSAPCAVNQSTNRLTGVSYEAQMFCVREAGLEEAQSSPPSSADKLEYCQRATRPRGDADGRADSRNCQINRQDYLFYLSSVITARIPSAVNADFDGNGRVSPDDLSIWRRGRCDNI